VVHRMVLRAQSLLRSACGLSLKSAIRASGDQLDLCAVKYVDHLPLEALLVRAQHGTRVTQRELRLYGGYARLLLHAFHGRPAMEILCKFDGGHRKVLNYSDEHDVDVARNHVASPLENGLGREGT